MLQKSGEYMGVRDFLKDIPYSLNGKNYGEIAERPASSGVKYIFGLVVISFFIMCIFGVPSVISFGEYIDKRFNRYTDIMATEIKGGLAKNVFWNPLFDPQQGFFSIYIRHLGFLDGFPGFVWALFSGLHYPIAYFKSQELKQTKTDFKSQELKQTKTDFKSQELKQTKTDFKYIENKNARRSS